VPPPPGEIENPDPKPGTNNNYTQDGYGNSTKPNTGGSYSECPNHSQPGRAAGACCPYSGCPGR
jgi:phospholipase C